MEKLEKTAGLTVKEVLDSKEFLVELEKTIKHVIDFCFGHQKARDLAYRTLQEDKAFEPERMKQLYIDACNKQLDNSKYSRRCRDFIMFIGCTAVGGAAKIIEQNGTRS